MADQVLVPTTRFFLVLDAASYLLPAGTDTDALGRRLADAMRDRSVLAVDVEDVGGATVPALVNPAAAAIGYITQRAVLGGPGVGKPGN